MTDILETLEGAWNEEHKMNLMHYCDLAAQEIRRLRARAPPEPTEDRASGDVAREAVEKHWHRLQGKRDDAKRHMISEFATIISNLRRAVRDWQDSSEAYRKDLEALRAMPLQDHAGQDSEQWALLYLHDWDPPREGQEHKWQPGLNIFPEIHGTYATLKAADQARAKMSDPNKYWVRRSHVILAEDGTK